MLVFATALSSKYNVVPHTVNVNSINWTEGQNEEMSEILVF